MDSNNIEEEVKDVEMKSSEEQKITAKIFENKLVPKKGVLTATMDGQIFLPKDVGNRFKAAYDEDEDDDYIEGDSCEDDSDDSNMGPFYLEMLARVAEKYETKK